jgi:hypothetical protein
MKKIILYIILVGILVLGLIQFLPFGQDHTNPAIVSEPQWSSPEARALVKEHCFQCHSNETEWPWYSKVAPASWLVSADVAEGRAQFNFSDWNRHPGELEEMIEEIQSGGMPPIQYWIFHPSSRLNEGQKQELINTLQSSLK